MRNCWAIISLLCLISSSCSPKVRSIRKVVHKEANYVLLEGRWSLLTPSERTDLPEANSVQVRCWKEMGTCTEAIAMLYTKSDAAGLLSVIMFEHEILEWSDRLIRTQSQRPVADIEIRISLVDRSVERTVRETEARGARPVDPTNLQSWVLR
jgi:hypothetical protein